MDMIVPAPFLLSRRSALATLATLAAVPAAGRAAAPMTVYRDQGCGCCLRWADHARRAGFAIRVINEPQMAALKTRLGVPQPLWSCHTALVNRHVVEGHVPLADVTRMLAMEGKAPLGIAVPGMPAGSPGMEMPDGRVQPFVVTAFDAGGKSWRFA